MTHTPGPVTGLHGLCAAALIVAGASLAAAQPFAYVVGTRDDPAPGNSGIQVLTVIDTATNTKVANVPLGLSCLCVFSEFMALLPDGSRLFVANSVSNTISVLDTATNAIVSTVNVGDSPGALRVGPGGTRLYVLDGYPSFSLSIFDIASLTKVGSIPIGAVQAYGLAISPDGSRAYVSTYGADAVKVIDLTLGAVVATIPVGRLPIGVDVTPDGQFVYVANYLGRTVSIISTATSTVVATLTVGGSANAIANSVRVTATGDRAYVASFPASVIDTQTRTLSATLQAGGRAVAFTPDESRAYFAASGVVSVVSMANNGTIATIPFNAATEGQASAVVIAPPQPVDPPEQLEVVSITGNLVTLRWVPPATGARPTRYALEGGVGAGQVLASLPTAGPDPALTFVAPSGSFYVRVHALNGTRRSTASNEIQIHVNVPIPPSPPEHLIAGVDGAALTLNWRNTFAGGAPHGLWLDVSGSTVASLPLGVTDAITFPGVPPGTYTLSMRATNVSGSSAASNTVTVTVPGTCAGPPASPAAVVAYAVGTSIFVRWLPPAAGPAPSSYVLAVTGAFTGSFATAGRSLSGAVGPGSYGLTVTAVNACGAGSPGPTRTVVVR